MNKLAPLVLFVYNRPDHTQRCLEELNKCALVEQTDFYIFSDGNKREKDKEAVAETRRVVDEFAKNSRFQNVYVRKSEVNNGLKKSVITGATDILKQYGKIIVLEDDLLVSEDFLIFMNGALDYYEKVPKIWSISGYTPDLKSLKTYDKDVYMVERGGSWGWATWYDRWQTIDWTASDYKEYRADKKRVKAFRKIGYSLPEMLDAQMNGLIDSWAVLFTFEKFKQGRYTVNPKLSRIKNIGTDGSGTHSRAEKRWEVGLKEGISPITFIPPELDKKVNRDFYNYLAGNFFIRNARKYWQKYKIANHKAMVLKK
jgi:hypothetical protein